MMETLSLLLSGFTLGFSFSKALYSEILHRSLVRWKSMGRKRGYHVHHSMWGVVILFLLPFLDLQMTTELILIGFSIGVITDHTLQEGFIFVTKESNDKFNTLLLCEYFFLIFLPMIEEGVAAIETGITKAAYSFDSVNTYPQEV